MICPEMMLIDRTSLYLERIAITPKQMMTTHTCIRSCTSLRAYLAFAWRMRSLRKHSEGGTSFETATLIGLIAGEWYPMNNEDSILLPVLTGGLAYKGCYSYGGPSSKPRPYQSPALPIASIKTVGSTIWQRKMLPVKLWFINVYTCHNPKPTLTVVYIQ